MIEKALKYYNTIKYLRPIQIKHRILLAIKNKWFALPPVAPETLKVSKPSFISLIEHRTWSADQLKPNNEFCFLNITQRFGDFINWNYNVNGKLWLYNLNYFDFLQQETCYKNGEKGLQLIRSYASFAQHIKDGVEPYPTSLRGINWIKFLSHEKIADDEINRLLYWHYIILTRRLEYHLLGNHLLENGFSLLFAAYYFNHAKFYAKGKQIIIDELKEEVLEDGGHFELSPMYHNIVLFRLLEVINLVNNNTNFRDDSFEKQLRFYASKMLNWMQSFSYADNTYAFVNDAAPGIAPSNAELIKYAALLNIPAPVTNQLKESGYRKFSGENYEGVFDVGQVGASYQSGHAHADTFNFCLRVNGVDLIVDTGISTYETSTERIKQRSTSAHNTIVVNEMNSSKVWSAFRMGTRANVVIKKDDDGLIEAVHNGYKNTGIYHTRKLEWDNNSVIITDTINGTQSVTAYLYLHFAPGIEPMINDRLISTNLASISFENKIEMIKERYDFCEAFNVITKAWQIRVPFTADKPFKFNISILKHT